MKNIFFILFYFLILNFPVCADESLIQIKQKLERIEKNISDLQKIVYTKKDQMLSNDIENQNASSTITVFDMRLRDIENELQAINLNYENTSFEIDELKDLLEKLTLKLNDAIISINSRINNNINLSSENINSLGSNQSDNLATQINQEENTLGTLKISSNDLSESNNIEETGEKIINKTDEKINYSSPEELFQVAFDNLRNQRFEEAKSDLELFIKDHDMHTLAGSAHYWLGEIYLLKKEYREAALVFAEGYQKYPDSVKSPNSLYKLAETLIKIEKKDEACNTLRQFILKYPNNKLIDKSEAKINDLQCS